MKTMLRFVLCAFLPVVLYSQVERWVYTYNGTGNAEDEAYVVTYGDDGNVYAAGYSTGNGTGKDLTVISLTPSGTERWVYIYNGPTDSVDIANDIVCDQHGNLYVAGNSYDNSNDAIIISLTLDGTERWVYRYNGTTNGADIANSITIGLNGNVYATGVSYGSGTGDDFIIISVDTAGTEQWVYRYNWTDGSDGAYALTYGADHNIYAAGYSYHFVVQRVFTVVSIDSTGTERWVYHAQGTGIVNEAAYSIVFGSDYNLYSAGMSYLLDFTVVNLDTTGNCEWDFIYGQPGEYDCANVVLFENNKVYTGGYFSTASDGYDLAIVCLSENGDTSWIYRLNGTGNNNDVAQDLILGLDCYLYTCGWSYDSGGQENLLAVRLDTSGVEKWRYTYDGSEGGVDMANSLIFGSDDEIYIAGCITDSLSHLDFVVICLDTTSTGVNEKKTGASSDFRKISPTIYTGPLQLPTDKAYKIFDITGRQIHTLNPAPGIYFIEANGEIRQKIVKVR